VSDRRSQAAVLFFVGAMALYLGGSDAALAYVKAGLQPLLVASGVILVGLGVAAVLWYRRDQDGHQPHGSRVAWLLALPPLALVLIAPPALGAFAASRQPIQPPPTIQASPTRPTAPGSDPFPPLIPPATAAPYP
jgi:membrane protease YdiL (CAAX protease family)